MPRARRGAARLDADNLLKDVSRRRRFLAAELAAANKLDCAREIAGSIALNDIREERRRVSRRRGTRNRIKRRTLTRRGRRRMRRRSLAIPSRPSPRSRRSTCPHPMARGVPPIGGWASSLVGPTLSSALEPATASACWSRRLRRRDGFALTGLRCLGSRQANGIIEGWQPHRRLSACSSFPAKQTAR
jgi:hypothetical protein